MLKKQVADILQDTTQAVLEGRLEGTKLEYERQSKAILNLFKAEVDKLTVISWERIRMVLQKQDKQRNNMFRLEAIAGAQLQDCKDKLLDLMGE